MRLPTTFRNACVGLIVVSSMSFSTGCDDSKAAASGPSPVRFAVLDRDSNTTLTFDSGQPGKYADMMPFTKEEIKDRAQVELLLMPGDMVPLEVRAGRESNKVTFWYVFWTDDPRPLRFGQDGPAVTLWGKPIFLALDYPGVADWIGARKAEEFKTIRGIRLGKDAALNLAVVKRLAHSGVLIDCAERPVFAEDANRPLGEAIVTADPTGLVVKAGPVPVRDLSRLKNLTHLLLTWPVAKRLPDLAKNPKLKTLYLELEGNGPKAKSTTGFEHRYVSPKVDLRDLGLAKLPHLHTLFLYGERCKAIRDLAPLAHLKELQHLTIGDYRFGGNLSSLPKLSGLSGLEIINSNSHDTALTDLTHLTQYPNLVKLSLFCSLSDNADIASLAKLKKLKVLVLPKDTLKERAADVDAIRKALPNCRVYGMCMGSRWILAVLLAGVAGGLVWRRLGRGRARKRQAIA